MLMRWVNTGHRIERSLSLRLRLSLRCRGGFSCLFDFFFINRTLLHFFILDEIELYLFLFHFFRGSQNLALIKLCLFIQHRGKNWVNFDLLFKLLVLLVTVFKNLRNVDIGDGRQSRFDRFWLFFLLGLMVGLFANLRMLNLLSLYKTQLNKLAERFTDLTIKGYLLGLLEGGV